ncbi:MAG: carbohydrate binding family 9 domain-containing protein [Acidimicrobiia bacterium]|nr:carbohydrate binding family 9 domain-containing protein [Acidimicrobiia bacterium]
MRPDGTRGCRRALAVAALGCAVRLSGVDAYAQSAGKVDYDTARFDRRLPATRASGPITLDGALDEPAWRDAPVAKGFLQNEPYEGAPATLDTEVRVLYDDRALYFGVFARDDQPSALIVSELKKDFNPAAGDGFTVVVDTFADHRNGFEFATNPAGARWDAQMSNEGRETNVNWDGVWDVRTRIAEDGWYAEIWIPFLTLRFTDRDPQTWGVNFQRRLRRRNEESLWSPVPRMFSVERVSLAGSVEGFRRLRPGQNLRLKPYAAASASTVGTRPSVGDFTGGVDLKYGVTSGLALDVTVNTDFSQVEADEQQVNLTRFSVLFPEKRDFFLENSGIFQFGLPSTGTATQGGGSFAANGRQNSPPDVRMFFSRQIGLSEAGAAIPILAGSRLTGRVGKYSMGALTMQQRAQGTVTATNFTALRLQRALFANSDVGVLLLNKDARGAADNRVAGVDTNFRFGQLSLGAYGVKSLSPESKVRGRGDDASLRANVNYQSRSWILRGAYETIGLRFNDELGFVPRVGVNHRAAYARYNVRPRWTSARGIREIGPHLHFDRFDRRSGTGIESRYFDWHLVLTMNDGGFFETGVNRNLEGNVRPFTLNSARGVRIAPGVYDFDEYFVLYRSNNSARVSVEARYSDGGLFDGQRRGYAVAPTLRINEHFNAAVSLQVNDIDLPVASYTSTLVATRVNYSLNTRVFVNALIQYNTDIRQWSSNARFNVIHRPLSDFFFVYNERRLDTTGDLVDRSVIAKLTWLVAF